MEGPSLRSAPRIALALPVVVRVPASRKRRAKTVRGKKGSGNLSAGGLLVQAEKLPLNATVHVKIGVRAAFEAEGVVRFAGRGGVLGIEFTFINSVNRKRLDKLIAELTRREILAS